MRLVYNWTVGDQGLHKNLGSHIDASHSRQPLVKGERLVRYEVNAVMLEYFKASRVEPAWKSLLVSCVSTRSMADAMQSVMTHSVYHDSVVMM